MYLSLKALTKISDVTESKLIIKRTRLQSNMSICHSVANHLAVQSICDRVLNFDLQATLPERDPWVRCDGLKVSRIEFL